VKRKLSEAQLWLTDYLKEGGFPVETEYRFCERMWRFDLAVPQTKQAFEIEGGVWNNGAHVRGKHFTSDMEKYNRAAADGWQVFRFTPEQILKGEAKSFIEEHLF
jgi:hypothetical protein